nr:hypothetical protein [Tanacetum cinerariifolium]
LPACWKLLGSSEVSSGSGVEVVEKAGKVCLPVLEVSHYWKESFKHFLVFWNKNQSISKIDVDMKLLEHLLKFVDLDFIFFLLLLLEHPGRIRDTRVKRIPLMYNKVSLRRRLRFLDKRRWDFDGILSE